MNQAASIVKINSIAQLYGLIPEHEKIMVDVLRQIVRETLPAYCREKISYNVPFFHGRKGICIIWPAAIPRGGIREGVLFGIWYGNKIDDDEQFLTRGTNKQVFYKIFKSADEIEAGPVVKLLKKAVELDLRSLPVRSSR
jgi:hypothetical protein